MDYNIYINKYNSAEEIQAALDEGTLKKPYIGMIEDASGNTSIDFDTLEPIPPIDYRSEYFTIEVISGGTLQGYRYGDQIPEYEINNSGKWKNKRFILIDVQPGDIIKFRGTGNTIYGEELLDTRHTTASFKVYGNIMSLLEPENFATLTGYTFTEEGAFKNLFLNCSTLIDASNLYIPFVGGNQTFKDSFRGCSNLVTGPILEEFYHDSYYQETISYMFGKCTNLSYLKCLFSQPVLVARSCWMSEVSSTGTFVKKAGTEWTISNRDGIPVGWTVEEE